jgi:hypothetical protein
MRPLISTLTCFGLFACVGKAPKAVDDPDAGVDAAAETGHLYSGVTKDYFTAATPMADATITSDGVTPEMTATSGAAGEFSIDHVPTGSVIFFSVAHASYRPTRNVPVTVADMPVTQDLYMMASADVDRQYLKANATPVGVGKAFLTVELKLDNGTPLAGIPLANITLVDAANAPVPGIVGPFFYGTAGDVDPALTTATVFNGSSRAAILDVPPGTYTLKVVYPAAGGGDQTMTVPIATVADGATLAATGGGGGGSTALNPKFSTDIYPRLQKAAAGGLGCANCHTLGGPAGDVLKFDDPAALTLTNMKAIAGVIDLATPANSLFLTKPLYEPAPYNHPNATFVDINDPDYKLFLTWIQQGALL